MEERLDIQNYLGKTKFCDEDDKSKQVKLRRWGIISYAAVLLKRITVHHNLSQQYVAVLEEREVILECISTITV